ncbi:MAG: DedA family protein [Bacteroidales bacterium]|nr:DedA family protein [Bacteroidales bacterium]
MNEVFSEITLWYFSNINYYTITLLMVIESSFIPFPSEIIVPPAAFKAASGELNIFLVVFFSTLGALIGALFNYYFALWIGRSAVYALSETRLARMLMIQPASIKKAEDYFISHGNSSTFIGRLIPAIRQLISIPAGLAKMPLKNFVVYTTSGALLWNIILAAIGYYFPKELIDKYYHQINILMIIAGVFFLIYLLYLGFFSKPAKKSTI